MTVGKLGPWTLAAAKRHVDDMRRELDRGHDPLAEKKFVREAPSVIDVWNWYSKHFLSRLSKSHNRDLSASWERKIIPHFGAPTKLHELSRAEIQSFVDRVTTDAGPVMANRCHSYLRSVLTKAMNDGLIPVNPAAGGIARNAEHGRDRFLTPKELKRMLTVLILRRGEAGADAISILILTGARKSEVLRMEWAEVDFEEALWVIPFPGTKQRKVHRVVLNSMTVDILAARQAAAGDAKFVFPSQSESGHLQDVRRTWISVKHDAGILDCKMHDLRHSYASLLRDQGKPLEMIGSMLGHSQAQTTKRYTHLYDDAAREASEGVADALR